MQRLFFLRAYGDFVIGMQYLAHASKPIQVIASKHLEPLYLALIKEAVIKPISIQFEDFGIQKGQLAFFTNKHFFSQANWKQLHLLKKYFKAHPNPIGTDYVEQEIRLPAFNFFTQATCKALVATNENVYQAFQNFSGYVGNPILPRSKASIASITIFPDARLNRKAIPATTLTAIKKELIEKGNKVSIARWNNTNKEELTYQNFEELIQLIKQADTIIGSDSLPVHIAQAMQKPHIIYYNKQGINRFSTPFALANQSFHIFYA